MEPVQELIQQHKTYFYGTAFFYAFLITFTVFISIMGLAAIIYGLGTSPILWILLPLPIYASIQFSNGAFLFTVTYLSALILEHKEVSLQDARYIALSFFIEIIKLPAFVIRRRDTLRRYLSYPHAVFSDKKIFSAYEDTKTFKKAIGGQYAYYNIPFIASFILLTGMLFLAVYLLPLQPYILFGSILSYTFITSFLWFYFKTPHIIQRTALYIYAKAGRILSPFTFDDLKKVIS